MSYVRSLLILGQHLLRVWRAGQLRFRLETFGLYYPALPYSSPWWRVRFRNLVLLLRHARSYARWVHEMEALKRAGPAGWWAQHGSTRREESDVE